MARGAPTRRTALLPIVLVLALGACVEDEVAEPPFVPQPGGELFLRYVALGNSITAGFQSGGIHEVLQNDAYPALLAEKAGAMFGVPALNFPGCPPPLEAPLAAERIAEGPCFLRDDDRPAIVQNLAVPGATILDLTDVEGPGGSLLTTLILGGRTPIEAMLDAGPTLVSAWIGNNDALGAALAGDTARLTPLATFEAGLADLIDAIEATPATEAILIGVADPMLIAPALQPGAYFWAVDQSGMEPVPLEVSGSCAPGTPGGSRLVSFLIANAWLAGQAPAVTIDCDADAFVLDAAEQAAVARRIGAFNQAIAAAADSHDWIYVDPGESLIGPALADPDLVRKCQALATATTQAELQAAVQTTCPNSTAPNFFGAYFSFDGIHPSSAAHAVIADTLAGRLNAERGLSLPTGG